MSARFHLSESIIGIICRRNKHIQYALTISLSRSVIPSIQPASTWWPRPKRLFHLNARSVMPLLKTRTHSYPVIGFVRTTGLYGSVSLWPQSKEHDNIILRGLKIKSCILWGASILINKFFSKFLRYAIEVRLIMGCCQTLCKLLPYWG